MKTMTAVSFMFKDDDGNTGYGTIPVHYPIRTVSDWNRMVDEISDFQSGAKKNSVVVLNLKELEVEE